MNIVFKDVESFMDNNDDYKKLTNYIRLDEFKNYFLALDDHYRLLSYISTKFDNGNLIDLGTHRGTSALALSYNTKNRVLTYDRVSARGGIIENINPIPDNIDYRIGNIFDETSLLLKADFIFVDINHEGFDERKIYKYLLENDYSGITLWDDIYFNDAMKSFWNDVMEKPKYDLTKIGHYRHRTGGPINEPCGTGLIDFSNAVIIHD